MSMGRTGAARALLGEQLRIALLEKDYVGINLVCRHYIGIIRYK